VPLLSDWNCTGRYRRLWGRRADASIDAAHVRNPEPGKRRGRTTSVASGQRPRAPGESDLRLCCSRIQTITMWQVKGFYLLTTCEPLSHRKILPHHFGARWRGLVPRHRRARDEHRRPKAEKRNRLGRVWPAVAVRGGAVDS